MIFADSSARSIESSSSPESSGPDESSNPCIDSSGPPSRTVAEWVAEGRRRLAEAGRCSPDSTDIQPREVFLLLGEILGWTEAQIRARDDRRLDTTAGRRLEDLLQRRCTGEPMAYILGRKEFYGRDFQVDSNVLIPRPETEHLIDEALDHLRSKEIEAPRILDLGTGSGCIAVTLACEFPDATVTATDISIGALGVAIGNAKSLGVERRVNFVAADLASCCRLGYFDLVVSNPPYVSEQAAGEMSAEVLDFEPHTALFADDHGRSVITALLEDAVRLRPEARVLIELGYDQGDWVEEAVRVRSYLGGPKLIRDLAGHSRVVGFSRTT